MDERKNGIYRQIASDLDRAKRYLDDLKREDENDKSLYECLSLLATVKTIIGNDKGLIKDDMSENYMAQAKTIESEINAFLYMKGYRVVVYPQGKKGFSEGEKYSCRKFIPTDDIALDGVIERTEKVGIADQSGNFIVNPEVVMYRYRGEDASTKKARKDRYLSNFFSLDVSIVFEFLFAAFVGVSLYVIDIESLLVSATGKPLISVLAAALSVSATFFIIDLLSSFNSKKPTFSDRFVFSGLIGVLAYVPMAFIEYTSKKVVLIGAAMSLVILYSSLRFIVSKFMKGIKTLHSKPVEQFNHDREISCRIALYFVLIFGLVVFLVSSITTKQLVISIVLSCTIFIAYIAIPALKNLVSEHFLGCLAGSIGTIVMTAVFWNIPLFCCSCLLMVSTVLIYFFGGKK